MGTGGVGGYFGGRLAEGGEDVTFIARGAHLAAIRDRGLRIESARGDVVIKPTAATDDPGQVGPVDIVLFCVKLWDVEAAARSVRERGRRRGAPRRRPGSRGRHGRRRPHLRGHPGAGRHPSHRQAGAAPLRGAGRGDKRARPGLAATLSSNIERLIWDKFIFLVAFSGMTALTRKPIGPIREDAETWAMFTAAMREADTLARAKGVTFEKDPVEAWTEMARAMPDDYRASMLEDLERGNRLELPWLSGAVARMGRELGIETRVNGFIATALKLYADP
jgi:2-dehydropantoate 2-reductase